MSKTVKIDYRGISLECQSICEMASNQLCKLSSILERLENGSKTIANSQSIALRDELLSIKAQIQKQMDVVLVAVKRNASNHAVVYTDFDFDRTHINARQPIEEAHRLRTMSNNLLTTRLTELEALLNKLLSEELEKNSAELFDRAYGVCNADGEFMQNLNSIQDNLLKQYIYLEWIKNNHLSFELLQANALATMKNNTENQFKSNRNKQIQEIREEMVSSGVIKEIIEKVTSISDANTQKEIQEIRERASEEIVGEQVRKKTVRIITEAIQKRNFIIPKGAIKIQRDANEVVVMAQKPHGEKAEFRISLDGKFIYNFNGYEGQACQKDIIPFVDDLEKIYGINIIAEEEIWSNPDKISTKHYQTVDRKYNKN